MSRRPPGSPPMTTLDNWYLTDCYDLYKGYNTFCVQ